MKKLFPGYADLILSCVALLIFILPHTTILQRPLIGLHDMDNGHLLTTSLLWHREGIFVHKFAPIYSFSPGDINLRTWGMVGQNNRMYHASYPPLSFWLVYLISSLPGIGVTVLAAKLTSLLMFVMALVALYVYLRKTTSVSGALLGSGMFALTPLSAYFFGGVVVADIVVFGFWIPAALMLTLYLKEHKQWQFVTFFIVLLLACLSEWIGFFAAASMNIYLLGSVFQQIVTQKKKQSDSISQRIKLLLACSGAATLALAITIRIYTWVASWSTAWEFWKARYLFRGNSPMISGLLSPDPSVKIAAEDTLYAWLSHVWNMHLWRELTPVFWYILAATCFVIVGFFFWDALKPRKKNRRGNQLNVYQLFFFLGLPPVIHTVALSQFHYDHDYSFLSYLPFFSVCIAYAWYRCTDSIERILPLQVKYKSVLSVTLTIIILASFFKSVQPTYDFLFNKQSAGTTNVVDLFIAARNATKPEDLILTSHTYMPDMWFYLQRNVVQWIKSESDIQMFGAYQYYPVFQHVYYLANYRPFADAVCKEKKLIPVADGWLCQLK